MKKFTKILILALCLSMLLSAFIAIPAQAEDSTEQYQEVVNENFENMTVGQAPTGSDWLLSGVNQTNSKALVERATVEATNKALHLRYNTSDNTSNITAQYYFPTTDNVNLSFDYMYDAMSPTVASSGIAINLRKGTTRSQALYIQKVGAVAGDDSAAQVGFLPNGSNPEELATLQKNEWYHFEVNSYNVSSGSVMEVRISHEGQLFYSETITFSTLNVDNLFIGNSSYRDLDESHYIDNIVLKAGAHEYSDDFEQEDTTPQNWTVSCNTADYDQTKVYAKVETANLNSYKYTKNTAANLVHKEVLSTIRVIHEGFDASTSATVSFDWLYESLTCTAKAGGMGVFWANNGTIVHGLLVRKNSDADDSTAELAYRNGGWVSAGFTELQKGKWYHFDMSVSAGASGGSVLSLKVSCDDELIFESSFNCSSTASFNQLIFSNYGGNDTNDVHWFDNFALSVGNYNFEENFETGLSNWTLSVPSSADSSLTFINTAPKDMASTATNIAVTNALYIEDTSTAFPKASRMFEASKTVIADFDFMLTSDTLFTGCVFGLGDSTLAPKVSRGYFALFPNTDSSGAYNFTATLKYYNYSWMATSATDIDANKWYHITLEAIEGKDTVAIYIDGIKILDAPVTGTNDEIDRIAFMGGGTNTVGDKFYIDNLSILTPVPKPATEFTDDISGITTLPSDYSTTGSAALSDGVITLSGVSSVTRVLSNNAQNGDFKFQFKTSSLDKAVQIALTSDDTEKILLRIREDGAFEYCRPTHYGDVWLLANPMLTNDNGAKTPKGAVKLDEWNEITIKLPYDRVNHFVYIYVNDTYIGSALYLSEFSTVNGIKVESISTSATVSVKDFSFAYDTVGVFKAPKRTETAPTAYLPLIIEGSRAMYLEGDSKPTMGAMSYADESTSVQFNKRYNSIGVDLGIKQQVNAIRVYTEAENETIMTTLSPLSYTVYKSDDNVNWTAVKGNVYNHFYENGKWTALVEFSGVEARYIKVNYNHSTGGDTPITVYPASGVRAEAKISRQYKMAGDFLVAGGTDVDPLHTPMVRNYTTVDSLTLQIGDSIGLNMGLESAVEAVELVGTGLSVLDSEDFKVYISNDNCNYTLVDNVILSRDERNGEEVYRLSFDSVECVYIKLHAVGEGVSVKLSSIKDGFAVYSSVEANSLVVGYGTGRRTGEGDFYTLPDGTLIMLAIGMPDAHHDFTNYHVLARASTDGGFTWGEPWIMVALPTLPEDSTEFKEVLSVSMAKLFHVDGEPGHMRMVYRVLYVRNDGTGYGSETYFVESFDYGRNWEDPTPIIHDDYPGTYTGGSSGNQITILSNGRVIFANTIYKNQYDNYGHSSGVRYRKLITGYVYYSDDWGATWTRSDSQIITATTADEISVAECANGDLLLTLRTRETNGVLQSISTDNGVTWSQPVAVEGMDSPSSTNVVRTIPATGDVLLVWNNEPYDPSNENGTRNPLTMGVTADNGLTYHNVRNLYEVSVSWPNIYFYGRNMLVQAASRNSTLDVAMLYHTISGVKTISDLEKAATPMAAYADGWLTGVSSTMKYSLDGGKSWKFCGGNSVQIGEGFYEILVKDIGTHESAPSNVQIISTTEQPLMFDITSTLNNQKLVLGANHAKYNKTIVLECDVNDLGDGSIIMAHGDPDGGDTVSEWATSAISLNASRIVSKSWVRGSKVYLDVAHGLDISGKIKVTVASAYDKATVTVETENGRFVSDEFTWLGSNGEVFVKSENAALANVRFSWDCTDYAKDIWFMGDSLFDSSGLIMPTGWTRFAIEAGHTNACWFGYGGRKTEAALEDFKNALKYDTPTYAVWCMGANNQDSSTAVNSAWKKATDEFLAICEENGITPILATIPNSQNRINYYKNQVVKNSGYRYIDFSAAVGANDTPETSAWTEGYLYTDGLHPTTLGAQAMYNEVIKAVPEIKSD